MGSIYLKLGSLLIAFAVLAVLMQTSTALLLATYNYVVVNESGVFIDGVQLTTNTSVTFTAINITDTLHAYGDVKVKLVNSSVQHTLLGDGSQLSLYNTSIKDGFIQVEDGHMTIVFEDFKAEASLLVQGGARFMAEAAKPPLLPSGYRSLGYYSITTAAQPKVKGKILEVNFTASYSETLAKMKEINESLLSFYYWKGKKLVEQATEVNASANKATMTLTKLPVKPKPTTTTYALLAPIHVEVEMRLAPLVFDVKVPMSALPMGAAMDKKGNLWVADTFNGLLWRYDVKSLSWSYVVLGHYPHRVVIDKKGVLWLTALNESLLIRYDPNPKAKVNITEIQLPAPIFDLALGKKDQLWLTLNDTLLCMVTGKLLKNGSFIPEVYNATLPCKPAGLAVDGKGCACIALPEYSAIAKYRFNSKTKKIELVEEYDVSPYKPLHLALGKKNTLWFTDRKNSIIGVYNCKAKTLIQVANASKPLCIAVDKKGKAWYTSSEDILGAAILSYNKKSKTYALTVKEFPAGNNTYAIVLGKKISWITKPSAGLVSYFSTKGAIAIYNVTTPSIAPTDFEVDSGGTLWILDAKAPAVIGIATKTIFKKPEKSLFYYELPMDSQPLRLAIDKKKNLWITLNSSKQILTISPKTGAYALYQAPPLNATLYSIAIDKKGGIWFTMPEANKLFRMTVSKKKVELLNTTVDSYPYELYIDSKGRAWITKPLNSSVALYEYKKVGKAFQLTKSAEYTFNGTPAAIALDRKCTGLWVVFNDTDQIALTDLKTGTTVYNDTFSWSSTPIEVAVDKKGYVWYAEKTSHRLVKLTKQLKKTELWLHEAIYLPLEPIQLFMDAKNGIWLLSPQGGVAYLSEKLPFKIT